MGCSIRGELGKLGSELGSELKKLGSELGKLGKLESEVGSELVKLGSEVVGELGKKTYKNNDLKKKKKKQYKIQYLRLFVKKGQFQHFQQTNQRSHQRANIRSMVHHFVWPISRRLNN